MNQYEKKVAKFILGSKFPPFLGSQSEIVYGHRFVDNLSKCIFPMKFFSFASDLTKVAKTISLPTIP